MNADEPSVSDAKAMQEKQGPRFIVANAGVLGAEKSTYPDALGQALNRDGADFAAVMPMDGYHLDNAIFNDLGIPAISTGERHSKQ